MMESAYPTHGLHHMRRPAVSPTKFTSSSEIAPGELNLEWARSGVVGKLWGITLFEVEVVAFMSTRGKPPEC